MDIDSLLNSLSEEQVESSDGREGTIERFRSMVNILDRRESEEFVGDVDTPEKLRMVIDQIKDFKAEFKGSDAPDKSTKVGQMKDSLARLHTQAIKVEDLLDKKESGKSLTKKERDDIIEFSDKVSDTLFHETFMKDLSGYQKGASGGKANKLVFDQSFPVEYTAADDEKLYGLVRVTVNGGITTWQGDRTREIVSNDPDYDIPVVFPLNKVSNGNYVITKNSKEVKALIKSGKFKFRHDKKMKELMDAGKLKFKDDDKTKQKVRDFIAEGGASINDRGDIKGLNQVLSSVEFWNNIKTLF